MRSGFTATDWIKSVATIIGGKYSGGATFAKCSDGNTEKMTEALEAAKDFASTATSHNCVQ